jgi:pimeloyl-ACP methyl ester carboxylesterase
MRSYATLLFVAVLPAASLPHIVSWVQERGYQLEEHDARTEDGVLLGLMRIPRPDAPAVLLQHGVLDSAWAWVFNDEFKALAFQLHDSGFDVWLGNNRGNIFSTRWKGGADARHDESFWNFTFDDMARYDVPALIGAVLNKTGREQLAYVGHSQGSMQMLIAASLPDLRDWIARRVSIFIALSPVAWLANMRAIFVPRLARTHFIRAIQLLFPRGFLVSANWRKAAEATCIASFGVVCKISIDLVCGTSHLDKPSNILGYSEIFPSGTSFKNMVHFAQGVKTRKFQRYDYSIAIDGIGNQAVYGQAEPPFYNLSGLRVPTALLSASEDLLSDPKDVDHLQKVLLPTKALVAFKRYDGFSHATWMLGDKEAGYFVDDVVTILGNTSANSSSRQLRLNFLRHFEVLNSQVEHLPPPHQSAMYVGMFKALAVCTAAALMLATSFSWRCSRIARQVGAPEEAFLGVE